MQPNARSPLWLLAVLITSGACTTGAAPEAASTPPAATDTPVAAATEVTDRPDPTAADGASSSPSRPAEGFPIEAFAEISESPLSLEVAADFQALLDEMAGDGGMAATLMSADGTWSGAAGTADGTRRVVVDDQFAIASITKTVVAAQIMQMVEAGELSLDDLAASYLPADFDFDTNQATIRQLLGMRSGIRNYDPLIWDNLSTDRQHVWTTTDLLDLVGDNHLPPGTRFQYSNTNYVLLGLIIEHVRGQPIAQVLRAGVLAVTGTERLVYQPDERPTAPMAMPNGESTAALELGGGYLPSIASVTSGGPAAAIASDSPSLARWFRALCTGEIVSPASLDEMTTFRDGYGLGLYRANAQAVGHAGEDVGFVAWAGCLPEHGAVVVVLSNRVVEDIGAMAGPLVRAAVQSD